MYKLSTILFTSFFVTSMLLLAQKPGKSVRQHYTPTSLTANNIQLNTSTWNMLRAPHIFSSNYLDPLIIENKTPRGAIFCRFENNVVEHLNIWVKIRAGSDEAYNKATGRR